MGRRMVGGTARWRVGPRGVVRLWADRAFLEAVSLQRCPTSPYGTATSSSAPRRTATYIWNVISPTEAMSRDRLSGTTQILKTPQTAIWSSVSL